MFFNIFNYTAEVSIISQCSLEETRTRLAAVIRPSSFLSLILRSKSDALIGSISGSAFRISRLKRFEGNPYRPFFVGSIISTGGATKLSGRFVMHPLVQIGITIIYILCLLAGLTAAAAALDPSSETAFAVIFLGPAIIILLTAFVALLKFVSRPDVEWITTHIEEALS